MIELQEDTKYSNNDWGLGITGRHRCLPRYQSSWGQHGTHLGPVGPRWSPCWPHEPCYQGCLIPGPLFTEAEGRLTKRYHEDSKPRYLMLYWSCRSVSTAASASVYVFVSVSVSASASASVCLSVCPSLSLPLSLPLSIPPPPPPPPPHTHTHFSIKHM